MKIYRRPQGRNAQPNLFDWADQHRLYALPFPARRIRDRFGLSPAAAAVTAELAGFVAEGR
jgi:hypothetical protein